MESTKYDGKLSLMAFVMAIYWEIKFDGIWTISISNLTVGTNLVYCLPLIIGYIVKNMNVVTRPQMIIIIEVVVQEGVDVH